MLVTGARAPAAVDWALSLSAAGHEVVLADCVPAHAARSALPEVAFERHASPVFHAARFREDIGEIVRCRAIDLVVPVCEEVFHLARLRETLAPAELFCDRPETLVRLHSKLEFLEAAREAGASPPKAVRFAGLELPAMHLRDCVLKREFSRFGGTTIIGPSRGIIARLGSDTVNPWIIQERVQGTEYCTFSVAVCGRLTAHCAYVPRHRLGGSSSFYFEPADHAGIEAFVSRFVALTGFHGQIGFDIIERGNRSLAPVDCNPRATSGVHMFRGDPRLAGALAGTIGAVVKPHDPRPVMLPLAMRLFGAPAALAKGSWRDYRGDFAAAVPAPVARPAALAELRDLGWYFGQMIKHHVSLTDATTVDIEWNGAR
jgi:hypothetical protein